MWDFFKNIFQKEKMVSLVSNNEIGNKTAIFYALDGETDRQSGNFKQAIENMTKAIELEPDNDMYYVTRALAYKALGDKQSALDDINKALELNNQVEHTHKIKEEIDCL